MDLSFWLIRVPLVREGGMHPFLHLSIGFWLYTALQCRSSMSSNFLVFHTSGEIPSNPAAFLFLIFLRTESSSCVNGPSLMSNCLLIILVIVSCVIFGGFRSAVSTVLFFLVGLLLSISHNIWKIIKRMSWNFCNMLQWKDLYDIYGQI